MSSWVLPSQVNVQIFVQWNKTQIPSKIMFCSVVYMARGLSPPHFPLQGPNQRSRPSCPSQPLPGVTIIFWSNINATILYLLTNPQPINIICQLFTDAEVCSQVPGGYIDQGSECIIDFLSSRPASRTPPSPRSAVCSFYFPFPFLLFHLLSFFAPFFYISPFLSCLCVSFKSKWLSLWCFNRAVRGGARWWH